MRIDQLIEDGESQELEIEQLKIQLEFRQKVFILYIKVNIGLIFNYYLIYLHIISVEGSVIILSHYIIYLFNLTCISNGS